MYIVPCTAANINVKMYVSDLLLVRWEETATAIFMKVLRTIYMINIICLMPVEFIM